MGFRVKFRGEFAPDWNCLWRAVSVSGCETHGKHLL